MAGETSRAAPEAIRPWLRQPEEGLGTLRRQVVSPRRMEGRRLVVLLPLRIAGESPLRHVGPVRAGDALAIHVALPRSPRPRCGGEGQGEGGFRHLP